MRVVLLLPTSTYRATDFVAAARALGAEVVVASDRVSPVLDRDGTRAVEVPFDDPERAAAMLTNVDDRGPVDAVIAVDDQGVVVAARAAELLGLPHNPPEAAARTRDKRDLRAALDASEVPQPRWAPIDDLEHIPDVGYPCVVKPAGLSGSQGVIRADDAEAACSAAGRASVIACGAPLLVEEFVPGAEVAVEGLMRDGTLAVLAVFDKPDPLDGPYFEETIYVTPSRLRAATLDQVARVARDAAAALGLTEGPVHAELRIDGDRVRVIDVAARSIGGLCARALRFGAGISLEEVILRHALGLPLEDLRREGAASGVMMLPIPATGTLRSVHGQEDARAVPGIVGLEISINPGRPVVALPEGDRYLGFLFARGDTPAGVEAALRAAHARLEVVVEPAP
ncbi:MAG: ATP-grasp domain-containing protein [Acidimicrobiia bacterium]